MENEEQVEERFSMTLVDTRPLKAEGLTILEKANAMTVSCQKDFEMASAFQTFCKTKINNIKEFFKGDKRKADELHASLCAKEKMALAPYVDAYGLAGQKMGAFWAEQERKRKEAEEAARRERERLEAEAARKHQEEVEKAQKEAEDLKLAAAATAEARGDKEKAQVILEAQIVVTVAHPAPIAVAMPVIEAPKAEGTVVRHDWGYRIVDPGMIPREYLIPDEPKIKRIVKALKGETKIPGVEVYAETPKVSTRKTGGAGC